MINMEKEVYVKEFSKHLIAEKKMFENIWTIPPRWNLLSFIKKLKTKIFDWKSQPLPSENYIEVGPQSKVKFIAAWFSLTRGTFGLTLKPKLMQVRFKERESLQRMSFG